MSDRKSIDYNRIVGIKGDAIYVLEDAFQYSSNFKGVTGYSMTLLLPNFVQHLIDERRDYYEEIWRQAVHAGNTENGLDDFAEQCWEEDQSNGRIYPGQDDSFLYDFYDLLWALHEHEPEKFRLIAEWWADQLDLDVDEFMELYEKNAGYEPSDFW
jgi:DNA polymerase sigma